MDVKNIETVITGLFDKTYTSNIPEHIIFRATLEWGNIALKLIYLESKVTRLENTKPKEIIITKEKEVVREIIKYEKLGQLDHVAIALQNLLNGLDLEFGEPQPDKYNTKDREYLMDSERLKARRILESLVD